MVCIRLQRVECTQIIINGLKHEDTISLSLYSIYIKFFCDYSRKVDIVQRVMCSHVSGRQEHISTLLDTIRKTPPQFWEVAHKMRCIDLWTHVGLQHPNDPQFLWWCLVNHSWRLLNIKSLWSLWHRSLEGCPDNDRWLRRSEGYPTLTPRPTCSLSPLWFTKAPMIKVAGSGDRRFSNTPPIIHRLLIIPGNTHIQ